MIIESVTIESRGLKKNRISNLKKDNYNPQPDNQRDKRYRIIITAQLDKSDEINTSQLITRIRGPINQAETRKITQLNARHETTKS